MFEIIGYIFPNAFRTKLMITVAQNYILFGLLIAYTTIRENLSLVNQLVSKFIFRIDRIIEILVLRALFSKGIRWNINYCVLSIFVDEHLIISRLHNKAYESYNLIKF